MKTLISKSKVRWAVAVIATVILCVLCTMAVQGEGLVVSKFVPALLLAFFAGILIILEIKIPGWLNIFLLVILPPLGLCCMEFYTHVPWDLTVLIFILNALLYYILFFLFSTIFGSTRAGYGAAPAVFMAVGLINYFVVEFRSSPIVPWDFYSIKTAASVVNQYTFTITYRLIFVLTAFVYLMILGEKTRLNFKGWRIRLGAGVISLVLLLGYFKAVQTETVENIFGLDDILFTPNVLYRNNGFMVAFLANLQYLNVEEPEDYSVQKVGDILEQIEPVEQEITEDKPNILVIMNEAFSDLNVYGEFSTSEEYLPFFNSLTENTVRGNLNVSVLGGNTANTEFEFLTGNTMTFMPAASVPFQQFITTPMPSLASQLGSLGYTTAALHPYNASGWNRDRVYPLLGFDELYFKNDFSDATTCRGYVDDQSAFDKLIDLYEDKGEEERLFAFEVTMQNHGGYSREFPDLSPDIKLTDLAENQRNIQTEACEKYLTLMKKTDEAFQNMVEYFEAQDEKTIILMFGDHQPSSYITNTIRRILGLPVNSDTETLEELKTSHRVPFLMWANYDIEEEEIEDISVNYLGGLLMEKAGIPMTSYQQFLWQLRQDIPSINAVFGIDGQDESLFDPGDEEISRDLQKKLDEYQILQYNNVCDTKNRNDVLFK